VTTTGLTLPKHHLPPTNPSHSAFQPECLVTILVVRGYSGAIAVHLARSALIVG
jgi:hypothetical protein